ncbi:hypothetical protein B0H11DRAFT_2132179 [Mycena galericulata]|nr:hypothetical protein B0H11DRAFT_2132179 [Mycena galericulata]
MSASQAARFRASFSPGAEGVYEDVCRLLPMKSRGGNALKTGAVQDIWALGTFGSHLHSLLGPSRLPMAPVITEAMKEEEVGGPPNGWALFHAYFRNADRCSNHLRHSTLGDTSSTRDTGFLVAVPHRVEQGARLPACTGCQASHYCSKECQRESWKDKQMPHRDFCPILKRIFQVNENIARSSRGEMRNTENLYLSAGLSDEEISKAVTYVVQLLEHFSHYDIDV